MADPKLPSVYSKLPPGYAVTGPAFRRVGTFNGAEVVSSARGMTTEEATSACWRHHNDWSAPIVEWPEARLGDARDQLAKALGIHRGCFADVEAAVEAVGSEMRHSVERVARLRKALVEYEEYDGNASEGGRLLAVAVEEALPSAVEEPADG